MPELSIEFLMHKAKNMEGFILERTGNSINRQFKELLLLSGWDLALLTNSSFAQQWGNYAYRVAQRLIALVEQETLHAYHNKKHINQVLSSAMLLMSKTELDEENKKELGMLLGLALLGHDLKHDGYMKNFETIGEREIYSASLVQHVFDYESSSLNKVYEDKISLIKAMIEATEPSVKCAEARTRYQKNPDFSHLCIVLTSEADILASALPYLGILNSKLLEQEFGQAGHPAGKTVATLEGRLYFLNSIAFLSPQSGSLHLEHIRLKEIEYHNQQNLEHQE